MSWRIYFTAEDLELTRVSPTLGPLAETTMALSLLRCPQQSQSLFSEWRASSGSRLSARMEPLMTLVPPGTRGLDLYTLIGEAPTIEQGIGAVLTMRRDQVLAELHDLDRLHRLPASAWAVAETGSDARRQLADAAQATYRALVEPYWRQIHAHLRAEHSFRCRILRREGASQLLTTLQSQRIRWRPPVLEVLAPGDVEIDLCGRGLRLVPSVFVGEIPTVLYDPADERAPLQLIFAAAHDLAGDSHLWAAARPSGTALAALVGRTRAAALGSVGDGCSTTELAGRVGISIAAASQHATVLRDAGLITTRRQGSAVLHSLTPLGVELLHVS